MDDDDDDIIITATCLFIPKISAILAQRLFFLFCCPQIAIPKYWLVVNGVNKIRRRQNL